MSEELEAAGAAVTAGLVAAVVEGTSAQPPSPASPRSAATAVGR